MTNTYNNRLRTALRLAQPTGAWTNGFGYDAAKRLTNVTSPAGGFTYLLPSTRPSTLVTRLDLPNTSYITNAYDNVARLLFTKLNNSSHTTLDSALYGYNVGNQRTTFTNAAGTYVQYTNDLIGQLKIANSSVNTEDRGYTYDAAWNLNYRTNNGTLQTFKVDGLNQLTNAIGSTCQYDANGNLRSNLTANIDYTYDDENQLAMFEQAYSLRNVFTYDGRGRLRQRQDYTWGGAPYNQWFLINTVRYIYDGMRVIQERNDANTPTVSYTRGSDLSGSLEGAGGIGGLLSRSSSYSSGTGNWSTHNHYHADGNGNITYLVNNSQTVAASYRYDPFGNTTASSGGLGSANTYRFSSKEIHINSGLYYYGYRWYAPNLQRWLNRDPIEEEGGINLYGFVLNGPVNFNDPLGLDRNHNAPPSSDYIFPKLPAPDDGPWDDGYTDCYIKCMLGLPTAADVAAHLGGAEKAAGAYYHFTDGRFTAWGRSSRVLVPQAVARINLVGALVSLCEALHCMDKCLKETSGADPYTPPPPSVPPYPPSWPGRGHNAPPIFYKGSF